MSQNQPIIEAIMSWVPFYLDDVHRVGGYIPTIGWEEATFKRVVIGQVPIGRWRYDLSEECYKYNVVRANRSEGVVALWYIEEGMPYPSWFYHRLACGSGQPRCKPSSAPGVDRPIAGPGLCVCHRLGTTAASRQVMP